MTTKKFDCVEMMHQGAEEVRKQTRGMTKKEEIAFWRQRSQKLRRRQSKTQGEAKSEPALPK